MKEFEIVESETANCRDCYFFNLPGNCVPKLEKIWSTYVYS